MHMSDCSVHNMPAYPNEPCDCGHELKVQGRHISYGLRVFLNQLVRYKVRFRSFMARI